MSLERDLFSYGRGLFKSVHRNAGFGLCNSIKHYEEYLYFYRPQTKLREGNVFTGVCDSVHRGSVWSQGGAWSGGGVPAPEGGVWSGGSGPERVPGGDPPRTATAAGGTHPTGMRSCLLLFYT